MDWTATGIGIAIGTIISTIVLSIVGNILTDPIKQWLSSISINYRRKRLKELEEELLLITSMRSDIALLSSRSFLALFRLVFWFILGFSSVSLLFVVIMMSIFNVVKNRPFNEPDVAMFLFYFLGSMLLYISGFMCRRQIAMLKKIKDFDSYKKEMDAKIIAIKRRLP